MLLTRGVEAMIRGGTASGHNDMKNVDPGHRRASKLDDASHYMFDHEVLLSGDMNQVPKMQIIDSHPPLTKLTCVKLNRHEQCPQAARIMQSCICNRRMER